ncbi:hypothetical protein ABTZ03_39695 [Kitasatospora sp. NPDC096077]|uniref:hypothetical protein n=1 Tax=Kitasatospora sp. NPDC096077 TaxID=3155544 RepID=UPI003333ADBE
MSSIGEVLAAEQQDEYRDAGLWRDGHPCTRFLWAWRVSVSALVIVLALWIGWSAGRP